MILNHFPSPHPPPTKSVFSLHTIKSLDYQDKQFAWRKSFNFNTWRTRLLKLNIARIRKDSESLVLYSVLKYRPLSLQTLYTHLYCTVDNQETTSESSYDQWNPHLQITSLRNDHTVSASPILNHRDMGQLYSETHDVLLPHFKP